MVAQMIYLSPPPEYSESNNISLFSDGELGASQAHTDHLLEHNKITVGLSANEFL
jgi:hypothetical protein